MIHLHGISVLFLLWLCSLWPSNSYAQLWDNMRAAMIREIKEDVLTTSHYINKRSLNPKVLAALGKVPRHRFVPLSRRLAAYQNRPLSIGHGQTISQPFIVALMTDLLEPESDHRVLEVGTGSGYQAAVLGELVDKGYSIEFVEPLHKRSKALLAELNYHNITTRLADGYYGWEAFAPFDGIIVTAASTHIPPALILQLKPGGRMVIPVGDRFTTQELILVQKSASGEISARKLLPVIFVPLTGEH